MLFGKMEHEPYGKQTECLDTSLRYQKVGTSRLHYQVHCKQAGACIRKRVQVTARINLEEVVQTTAHEPQKDSRWYGYESPKVCCLVFYVQPRIRKVLKAADTQERASETFMAVITRTLNTHGIVTPRTPLLKLEEQRLGTAYGYGTMGMKHKWL
ncbi:hypothetical protein BJ508DRAFT_311107 [Ascobolus immersus RN42]|uniref:Uncharacterized protein n=1 Tax=Ascobolus immersus RN42 TaxID=1160509 RepID=A0A3N4HSV5_ASCIM|nr:hypothetical protein BJ508DRAFT_311107 [Ascobolus immersus RN42]